MRPQPTNDSVPAVLHVTERWGGGVAAVVQQHVDATPDLRHYLLCQDNEWTVRDRRAELFVRTWDLPSSQAAAVSAVRRLVNTQKFDVVHAHSSTAGAWVRMRSIPTRVVYTPHAYATLARRGSKEWTLGQAERILGLRRVVIAAVGDDEITAAHRLSPRSQVVRVHNLPDPDLRPTAQFRPELQVVMTGRLSAQKDPGFFAQVANEAGKRGRPYTFHWLGDGEQSYRRVLTDAGVRISGWLPVDDVHARQGAAQAYLHSATYEGSSLSILDAAALGLPTIGRPVPGVRDVDWLTTVENPIAALRELDALTDPDCWSKRSAAAITGVADHNPHNLRSQLLHAYGLNG